MVVDDSAFMRCAIGKILGAMEGVEVVGYAGNGREAVEKARQLKPGLVTLDIEMPEMDGLNALPRIRHACNATVLMVSSLTREGTSATLTALRFGAADFISKDRSQITSNLSAMESELRAKVGALFPAERSEPSAGSGAGAGTSAPAGHGASAPAAEPPRTLEVGRVEAVVIGSSTGGPPVLEELIGGLSGGFGLPIVVAQHMPAMFTRTMAERLNEMASVRVLQVDQVLPMRPGHVYIAEGGRHVRLTRRRGTSLWVEPTDDPAGAVYRPSVDELFRSAAGCCGSRCLALVLTGMGEDGRRGAEALRAAGAAVAAQDAGSCVVYGMPKAVVEAGLASATLTPEQMLRTLAKVGSRPAGATMSQ